MARRRQSAFEDLIDVAALLPWWVAVTLAIVAYLVIHPFAEAPPPTAATMQEMGQAVSKQLYRTLATFGQYLVPAAFLMGAAVSAVGRAKRKKLLAATAEVGTHDAVKSMSWQEFEMLVGEAFRRQGFAVRETAAGADGGNDLELRKDSELFLVQCKQWRATKVGVAIVRELFGAMAAAGAAGAFVVTSGVFTKEAQRFAEGRNITLVDGNALQSLIGRAQDSKKPQASSEKPIATADNVHDRQEPTLAGAESTPQCATCHGPMVKRVTRRGSSAGKAFWGCADYPKCRGTREM
jgi:restriction system protein